MSDKGKKESSWRVMNRCFDILLRLMRGKTSRDEIRDIIRKDVGAERKLTEKAMQRRFDEDKRRLKDWFEVDMDNNRSEGEYELIHIGRPLIDLSEDAVRGMAFLEQNFDDNNVPMAHDVRNLLRSIEFVLPHERVKEIKHQYGLLQMKLGIQDTDNIPSEVLSAIETSTAQRQRLQFAYGSPQRADGSQTTNIIEPIHHYIANKHHYVEGFYLQSHSKQYGWRDQNRKFQKFRLDRMSNPIVLPTRFPANQRIPKKELVYILSPNVANLSVTEHFEKMQTFYNDDGSVKVVVESHDLFTDLRLLLHYGANCRVIGGDDALYEMEQIVKDLYRGYFGD